MAFPSATFLTSLGGILRHRVPTYVGRATRQYHLLTVGRIVRNLGHAVKARFGRTNKWVSSLVSASKAATLVVQTAQFTVSAAARPGAPRFGFPFSVFQTPDPFLPDDAPWPHATSILTAWQSTCT